MWIFFFGERQFSPQELLVTIDRILHLSSDLVYQDKAPVPHLLWGPSGESVLLFGLK